MSKDPAFLFYSSDFLNGVSDLTMEERGQYITLLCLQHQKGAISEKTIRLSVGSVSVDVLAKFEKDAAGNFFNKRLVLEMEKRANFTESRRNNGVKGGRPPKKDKTIRLSVGKPKQNHMEDENENVNDNINKKENEKKDRQPNFEIIEHPYLEKIKSDYPILLKMKEPLTQAQAEKLEIDVGDSLVYEKMEAMANRLNLLKNYSSVNLTIRSWSKLNTNNGKSTTPNPKEPKFGRIPKSDLERFMQSEIPIIFKRNPDLRGDHG